MAAVAMGGGATVAAVAMSGDASMAAAEGAHWRARLREAPVAAVERAAVAATQWERA